MNSLTTYLSFKVMREATGPDAILIVGFNILFNFTNTKATTQRTHNATPNSYIKLTRPLLLLLLNPIVLRGKEITIIIINANQTRINSNKID